MGRYPLVEHCGLRRSAEVRFGLWLAIAALVAVLVVLAVVGADAQTILATAGLLLAAEGLVIGAWQWRSARYEAAIDRFYDRMKLTNDLRLQVGTAMYSIRDDPSLRTADTLQRRFYIFAELDNLEYAVHKYEQGYMSGAMAERALATFRARCRNLSGFHDLVVWAHDAGVAYQPTTWEVVGRLTDLTPRPVSPPPADGPAPPTAPAARPAGGPGPS